MNKKESFVKNYIVSNSNIYFIPNRKNIFQSHKWIKLVESIWDIIFLFGFDWKSKSVCWFCLVFLLQLCDYISEQHKFYAQNLWFKKRIFSLSILVREIFFGGTFRIWLIALQNETWKLNKITSTRSNLCKLHICNSKKSFIPNQTIFTLHMLVIANKCYSVRWSTVRLKRIT